MNENLFEFALMKAWEDKRDISEDLFTGGGRTDNLVPVTIKLPVHRDVLRTIDTLCEATGRCRSDLFKDMLAYGFTEIGRMFDMVTVQTEGDKRSDYSGYN